MSKAILVVDDDPLYVQLVSNVFETQDHTVIAAHNGVEALRQAQNNPLDLIVSDIEMPDMNGLEFHEQLRTLDQHKDTPFIFLSGTTDQEVLSRASSFPNTMLIRKSNLVKELLTFLETIK